LITVKMKITQGYQSKSLSAFEYAKMHKLRKYDDRQEPLVVFGCYSNEDIDIIKNHKSTVIIQWAGLDSKRCGHSPFIKARNIINVSPHPHIVSFFERIDVKCHFIKWAINETIHSQVLGDKVYSYVNKNNPVYYGSEVLKTIKTDYEILIADYTYPTSSFPKDLIYSKAFLGLQLCNYTGGGFGIVDMGLRGIRVVTNVLKLPHTIPWSCTCDIEEVINAESCNIGKINKELAWAVYDSVLCTEKLECYDLDQLMIA